MHKQASLAGRLIHALNVIECICHGRKSNLVEFQILPVESPIGVSTRRKSNWTFNQDKHLGDLGIALGSEI